MGERRRQRRIGVRRELAFFYGIALLALIVVSIVAVAASRSVARTQALQDAERSTTRLARAVVGPLLGDVLNGNNSAREQLDQAVANRMADGYLTEVTIWDATGRVVYANEADEIGSQLDPPAEVTDAIENGAVSSQFEDQPEATGKHFDPNGPGFVEVYVPLDVPGRTKFAFEAYYDYARVDETADTLLWQLLPLVLAPLLLLQVIQSPIPASLARRVRRHEAERSELLERTLSVSDSERTRVAADLHDGPIQDLAGVTYALEALSPSTPELHRPLMRSVQSTIAEAIKSLRRLMTDLYPPDLSADRLPYTISNLATPLRDSGIDVDVMVDQLPDLDSDIVTTIYRVAREALANVAQHAAASHVVVSVMPVDSTGNPRDRFVRLSISDNGVGLDSSRLDRRVEGHLGLRLLTDRVEKLGGTFTIASVPAGGTEVRADLPVRSRLGNS